MVGGLRKRATTSVHVTGRFFMILDHVADRACRIVEPAASLYAECLGHLIWMLST